MFNKIGWQNGPGQGRPWLLHCITMRVMFSLFLCILIGCVGLEQPTETNPLPPITHQKDFRIHTDLLNELRWFSAMRLGLRPKEISPIPPEEVSNYKPERVQSVPLLIKQPDSAQAQITWIGHSTFLIQIEGSISLRPQFSDYSGPNSFLGINRVVPPGVPFEGLPPSTRFWSATITTTIWMLQPWNALEMNPPILFLWCCKMVWKEKDKECRRAGLVANIPFCGLKFHSVPLQHFSGRTPFKRNETLWSGWVIESKLDKIFFAGDTGYSLFSRKSETVSAPFRSRSFHWCLQTSLVHEPRPCRSSRSDQDSKRDSFQIAIAGHWEHSNSQTNLSENHLPTWEKPSRRGLIKAVYYYEIWRDIKSFERRSVEPCEWLISQETVWKTTFRVFVIGVIAS